MEFIIIESYEKNFLTIHNNNDGKTAFFSTRAKANKRAVKLKDPIIINLVDSKSVSLVDRLVPIMDEMYLTGVAFDALPPEKKTPENDKLYQGIKVGLQTAIDILTGSYEPKG